MKIEKYLAAPILAVSLLTGGAAYADSMVLAGGEVLDLGEKISVYPGERSFFGSQIHDWLLKPDAAKDVEQLMKDGDLVSKNDPSAKDLSEMAVSILRSGKVYQVRALDNDTYYQGMVLSLPVTDADMLKVSLLKPSVPVTGTDGKEEAARPELKKPSLGKVLKTLHSSIDIRTKSDWEETVTKGGIPCRTADVQLSLVKDGFTIPVYIRGIITRKEGETVYTVFGSDQASGNYFQPVLAKALKEAKHETK